MIQNSIQPKKGNYINFKIQLEILRIKVLKKKK